MRRLLILNSGARIASPCLCVSMVKHSGKRKLIVCDRCHKPQPDSFIDELVSGGVYVVRSGYWSQFRRAEDEEVICDACMWSDPLYLVLHGERSQAQ